MEKRGQVTIFILIGIGIIFAFILVYYLSSLQQEAPKQTAIYDQKSLEKYVQSCLEISSDEQIRSLSLKGFFDGPGVQQNETIAFWCRQDAGGCMQLPVFKQDIENVLNIKIMERFMGCVDIEIFEEQGFDVVQALPEIKTKIEKEITAIELDYPILLSKGAEQLTPKKITVKRAVPLGKLIEYAIHLINTENNGFDISDLDILAEKEKPYPHIIYSLSESGLVLKFAIEGKDTVSNIGFDYFSYQKSEGCCFNTKDSLCYENVDEESCEMKGGVFNPLCSECSGPLIADIAVNFEDCEDAQHGSSWCVYEEPSGMGSDLVGSRHKKEYCYDGKVYVEYCRDYREEICVEDTNDKNDNKAELKALCRPNRFSSCSECINEDCCNDIELRDCYWNNGICVPAVPPGLKHNELLGSQICAIGNMQNLCNGTSCGHDFANYAAEICAQQGDCGMSFNVQNYQGKSFAIFDRFKPILQKATGVNLALPMKIQYYDASYGSSKKSQQLTNMQSSLLQTWYGLLRIINREVSSNLINDSLINNHLITNNPQITVNSLCGVWQAPEDGRCNLCNGAGCSEYLCISLGKNCIFDYNYGNPLCKEKIIEKVPPQINIERINIKSVDIQHIQQGIQQEIPIEAQIEDKQYKTASFREYKIEKINRGEDININIASNEPTICMLSLSPGIENIPIASTLTFSNNHSLTARVPVSPLITQKLITLLGLSEDVKFKKLLENPHEFLSDYITKNNGLFREFNKLHTLRLEEIIRMYSDKLASTLKRINKDDLPLIEYALNQNKDDFAFFVNCIDKSGNRQEINHLILADIYEGNVLPKLLGMIPENNTPSNKEFVTAYFNEPVQCKWDINNVEYENMHNTMRCADSVYDYSSNFGGSYSCTMQFGRLLYAKCRDNPQFSTKYTFTVRSADGLNNESDIDNELDIANEPNIINELNIENEIPGFIEGNNGVFEVSLGALFNNNIVFSSPSSMQKFVISLDSPESCTLKDDEKTDYELNCITSGDDLFKGLFNCNAVLPIPQPDKIIFTLDLINGTPNGTKNDAPYNTQQQSVAVRENLINIDLDDIQNENQKEKYEVVHNLSILNVQLTSDREYSCAVNSSIGNTPINTQVPCIYNKGSVCGASIANSNKYTFKCRENIPAQKTYTVNCDEYYKKQYAEKQEEVSYAFSFKEPNLRIVSILPEGEVRTQIMKLEIKTNIDAEKCAYNNSVNNGLPLIKDNNDNTLFTTTLNLNEGKNNVPVMCEDSYGNTAVAVAEIYYLR